MNENGKSMLFVLVIFTLLNNCNPRIYITTDINHKDAYPQNKETTTHSDVATVTCEKQLWKALAK